MHLQYATGSPFTIHLRTLLDSGDHDTAGAMANFDPNSNNAWRFLQADGATVNGTFDPAIFAIVTDEDFVNSFNGVFSIEFRDTNSDSVLDALFLVYTA